ncbi:MAG TPA: pyridoxal phosphate-dependent aminotransferase [Candidatus Latescibacteria bacterium]|nr:pyridoxal phosphate-dependent aminotransferase [Candidatus Latescibacterota bacterium]
MLISRNIQRIKPSVTLAITARAKAMLAEGIDVVSLSAGEPDFDTPQNIKDAAIRAINQGFTKYTPATGILELRKAICKKFERDNGLAYDPSQVIVSCGGKHSIYLAILALVDEGDEVIIPRPYWVSYPEQVRIAGGNPVVLTPTKENGLKVSPQDLRSALTSRTKLLILNSPSNPSGIVYTRDELAALAEVVLEAGIYVLSDEIYEKIIYDGARHCSIASLVEGMVERTVVVNGVSKSYSMTGWRIGYAAGPEAVISAMGKIQSQETSNSCSIAQMAALEALTGPQDSVGAMIEAFDRRRRYIVDRLNSIEGISCPVPQGAFYVFPDVSSYYGFFHKGKRIEDSVDFCEFLLDEMKVACVPGAGFGMDTNIRLSYATSLENIEKAMDRIEEGLKKLQR